MDILLTLVKRCPEVCESNHFAVLLGAYGATLSVVGKSVSSGNIPMLRIRNVEVGWPTCDRSAGDCNSWMLQENEQKLN